MLFSEGDCYARKKGLSSVKTADYEISLHGRLSGQLHEKTFNSLAKTIVIMKLMAVFLFAAGLQVSARTYSQTVSFSGKNVPLSQIFQSVQKQTGYEFFYSLHALDHASTVTVDLRNVQLSAFLDLCLRDQPLTYTIAGKTVFIKVKEVVVSDFHADGVAAGDHPIIEIKGKVTNSKGEPLVNANVTVKRTGHGTITDANGGFVLRNVNSDDVVTVSFIGYKTQAVSLKDRISLTLVLEPTTNELDKVVVQAYGTTSQRLATGNIGTVRAEDIEKQPVINVLQALQGQVPGLVVTQTSGYASSPFKVEIRGRNSINGLFTSDPLYIIDGVPLTILEMGGNSSYNSGSSGFIQNGLIAYGGPNGQSPFFNINPADVESIEVLMDADATAIYGSRGANGVILITTKKGKAGKSKFDINVYQGTEYVTRHYKMLNTKQYLQMRREAFENDGIIPDINNAPDLISWDTTRNEDWQKILWGGIGKNTDAQMSLSGGDPRTTFRIGAGFHRQTSILTVSGADQRGSVSLNLNHKGLNQKFNTAFTSEYSFTQSDLVASPGTVTLPPNAPSIYNKNGDLNFEGWSPLQAQFPFGTLLQNYGTKSYFLNSSLNIMYEIFKGLSLKASIGYNNAQVNQTYLTPIASQNPNYNPTGISQFGYNSSHTWIAEPQIEYSGFVNKGKLNILVGGSDNATNGEGLAVNGFGYTNDALLRTISNAPSKSASDNFGQYKYAAIFGRINYNWEDKYIINLNARRDGSSRFGPGKQFGNFGSIGLAWIITEEKWIKNKLPFLSFGKIRGSYGLTGSDQVGDYQYLSRWSTDYLPTYNGILPLVPIQHADSFFHWQVNHKTEIALDLAFLKDKISLEVAWYRNRCGNQLISFPTPLFTGFNSVTANSPADVENQGLSILLATKVIDNKTFKWSTKFNIGLNKNKLIAYPNLAMSPYADNYVIGQSLNITKLLHYTGVNPQTGTYSFQDKNKDNQISINPGSGDDRFNYDLSPKFSGGLTSIFSYKNVELSLIFYFIKQRGINALSTGNPPGSFFQNQPIEVLSRWQKSGDITGVARYTTQPGITDNYFHYYSDGNYTDASFIRLQNFSISYTISNKILKKAGMQGGRVYVQGQNFFVFTKYKGLDPETQNFGAMPPAKIITGGLSFNF